MMRWALAVIAAILSTAAYAETPQIATNEEIAGWMKER
jgi:hypothetical protein